MIGSRIAFFTSKRVFLVLSSASLLSASVIDRRETT